METTIMISSIIWPIMLLLWVWMLINTKFYQKILNVFVKEKVSVLVSWIGWAVAWIFMVSNHNIWEWTTAIIISILSWIVLIKSSLIIAFPLFFMNIVKKISYPNWLLKIFWIIYILFGIYLTNFAYSIM